MKARIPFFVLGIIAAAGAAAQAPGGKAQDAGVYAEIVFAQGEDVVVLSSGRQRALKDPIGERLAAGDQIQTGVKTSVELVLMPRKSRLRLSENTVATIREISSDGATGIELIYGRLRSKVARLTDREAQYNVRAPNVVAAVRGTDFGCDVTLDPSGKAAPTKVYCFEGSVDVSSPLSPGDMAPVAVDAGAMAIVSIASAEAAPEITRSPIDKETLSFWKANEFTERLPKGAAPPQAAPPASATVSTSAAPVPEPLPAPTMRLDSIRKGIAAKNGAIIGSGVLFIAGAALGGTGYYFKESNPDLSDKLLLSGALTAALAIPSLVLAISIDPLAKAGQAGE